ncbi:MAG TPA: hypothetical protein VJZ72_06200 [Candidatus Limnocylindrales bacterium]|nr:hypothetical protein [Candidatus Limnocylindrales bacterium]
MEAHEMGSRDRPHKETKKKPKDRGGISKIQPMSEPPMSVEIIKPKRKPRWDEDRDREEG